MKSIGWVATFCGLVSSVAIAQDAPKPDTLGEAVRTVANDTGRECSDSTRLPPSTLGSGSATNYCQSSLNSANTMCLISNVGSLDLADNTFGLMATGAVPVPQAAGRFIYGTQRWNTTFGNGYLCIYPSLLRGMRLQSLGNGTVVRTMTTHPADFSLFTPGTTWNFQFWYRDHFQPPSRFNLSDGLHVTFAP